MLIRGAGAGTSRAFTVARRKKAQKTEAVLASTVLHTVSRAAWTYFAGQVDVVSKSKRGGQFHECFARGPSCCKQDSLVALSRLSPFEVSDCSGVERHRT